MHARDWPEDADGGWKKLTEDERALYRRDGQGLIDALALLDALPSPPWVVAGEAVDAVVQTSRGKTTIIERDFIVHVPGPGKGIWIPLEADHAE